MNSKMNSIKRTSRFLSINMRNSTLIFWLVFIFIGLLSYLLSSPFLNILNDSLSLGLTLEGNSISYGIHMGNGQEFGLVSIAGANMMPILIYYLVYIYTIYYEELPIVIGFSGTRKNFFLSLIFNNIVMAAIFSIIQTILLKIDIGLIRSLGQKPYVDFMIFNTEVDNPIFIALTIFLMSICALGFINLLASLNYRFGYKIWIIFAIFFILLVVVMPATIGMKTFDLIFLLVINLFFTRIDLVQFFILLITIIATYGLSMLVIKDINIKSRLV